MVDAFRSAEPGTWARRGYPDRFIFAGFPFSDCSWQWVSLSELELRTVSHIRNEPTWREIAGPRREPGAAAAWVRDNPTDPVSVTVRAIHSRLILGEAVPPIVLVGLPPGRGLVVIEGNKRTVAAVMGGVSVPDLTFLLGTSPSMNDWAFYTDSD
jgi:hypothetical protein